MKNPTKEILLLFTLTTIVKTQKSLENFIKKKTIEKSAITILNIPSNETNYTWIEYQYLFENKNNLKTYLNNDVNDRNQSLLENVENSPENSLNIYYDLKHCLQTRGERYSKYLQSLLDVLVENTELEVMTANETQLTDETNDLLTCDVTGNFNLGHYRPLYAILTSKFALVYKKQYKAQDIFVLTFVGILWLCFLVILLLLAICLSISTYYYWKIYKERRWSWVEITLWAIAAACQQGFSYTPMRITSQFFFLLGYINAYVLYTAFTAAITSTLIQQETVSIDIERFNIIGYDYGGENINRIGGYKIASHSNNLTQIFEKVNAGANIGFAAEILIDRYIHNDKRKYRVITLDKSVGIYQESFFIQKTFKNQEKLINQRLIRMFESGILQQIRRKTLKNKEQEDTTQGYSNASLEHVKSAILLFLIGLGLAMVFLIVELAVFGYRHR